MIHEYAAVATKMAAWLRAGAALFEAFAAGEVEPVVSAVEELIIATRILRPFAPEVVDAVAAQVAAQSGVRWTGDIEAMFDVVRQALASVKKLGEVAKDMEARRVAPVAP